jgi:WD repeat-containing protein 35
MRNDPVVIKQLYVLAALEVERHHSLTKSGKTLHEKANASLNGLLHDQNDSSVFENSWRGAEAWHYYILAQRQFYLAQLDASVITCLHLVNYIDLLGIECVYSLLALTRYIFLNIFSLHAGKYRTASQAFIKLSNQENAEYYDQLAVKIFSKNKPIDQRNVVNCTNCLARMKPGDTTCPSCRAQYPICVASGRPIIENIHFMCHVCKHRAMEIEIASLTCCPLCHTSL